jgi:hypothetical protein
MSRPLNDPLGLLDTSEYIFREGNPTAPAPASESTDDIDTSPVWVTRSEATVSGTVIPTSDTPPIPTSTLYETTAAEEEEEPVYFTSPPFASTPMDPLNVFSLNYLQQSLGQMAVNDATFTPKPFTGLTKDTEKAEQWLEYLEHYTEFRGIRGLQRLQLFKLLMTDQAAAWLRSLPDAVTSDYGLLVREFRKRFSLTDIDRWRKASALWSRDQRKDESVDAYVTELQNAARLVPVKDETLIRFALIRGLLPAYRLHVLQSEAATLDDVIRAARVAEAALSATDQSSEVAHLTQQVSQLLAKLDEKSVAAINQPSSATTRVTFADEGPSPSFNRRRDDSYSPPRRQVRNMSSPSREEDVRHRPSEPSHSTRSPNLSYRRRDFGHDARDERLPTRPQQWLSRGGGHSRQWSTAGRPTGYYNETPNNMPMNTCRNCGKLHELNRQSCPARDLSCYRCNKRGHISRFCRSAVLNQSARPYGFMNSH